MGLKLASTVRTEVRDASKRLVQRQHADAWVTSLSHKVPNRKQWQIHGTLLRPGASIEWLLGTLAEPTVSFLQATLIPVSPGAGHLEEEMYEAPTQCSCLLSKQTFGCASLVFIFQTRGGQIDTSHV